MIRVAGSHYRRVCPQNIRAVNAARLHRPALVSLRAVANAWPTSSRFQELTQPCCLCSAFMAIHCSTCSPAGSWLTFLSLFEAQVAVTSVPPCDIGCCWSNTMHPHVAISDAAVVDCLYETHRALRHDHASGNAMKLLDSRWRTLCRSHRGRLRACAAACTLCWPLGMHD